MNTLATTVSMAGGRAARLMRDLCASAVETFGPKRNRRRGVPIDISPPEIIDLHDASRDCYLVLDASPSMNDRDWPPTRLGAAQEAAKAFVHSVLEVSPTSRIAVIAYGKRAVVHCRPTPARSSSTIAQAIDKISFIDSTNITAGLEAVAGLLERHERPNQIVVLSDGHHNSGKKPGELARKLKTQAIIETVGIGGSPAAVDEPLLKDVASKRRDGSPRYRWIGDRSALVRHFQQLGGGLTRE